MTLTWRGLAGLAVAAVAVGVTLVPIAGHAETCARTVSISPQVSAGEGTGTLTFEVYSTGCAATGEVAYTVLLGTASRTDFTLLDGVLRWASGDARTRQITAQLRADSDWESITEDFTVRLVATTPTVRVAVATGQGRILDDDGSHPSSVADDGLCTEANIFLQCACSTIQGMDKDVVCVEIGLSTPVDQGLPVTIRWSTVDGTARAGVDYLPVVDQTTTVPAGASRFALPVQVLPRPPGTATEWFEVRISAMSWPIADPVAVVRILGT